MSIRNQEFLPDAYEVLVVDNGSTDRTHQIVRDFGLNLVVIPDVSVAALRNRGVAASGGQYLAFVDADVELSPHWLQNGLAAFRRYEVAGAGCFPGVPQPPTWVQQTWDVHQRGDQRHGRQRQVEWLPSMNILVRRDMFVKVSGFNERLETAEDVDLCYRLGQFGSILSVPGMEAIHWGEARDLKTFWRKEVWRGKGNLKGVLAHGLRRDELPSLGYPIYILCFLLALTLSCLLDLSNRPVVLTLCSFGLLILPALALAAATMRRAGRPTAFPGLFLLYLVYGFARAYSMVSASVHHRR